MEPVQPVQRNIYYNKTYKRDIDWLQFNNMPRVKQKNQVQDQRFCSSSNISKKQIGVPVQNKLEE